MKYDELGAQNTRIIKLIVDKKYTLLRHTVLLLGVLVTLFYSAYLSEFSGVYKYYRLLCVYSPLMAMIYININVLTPRFFFKGRYILYLVLLFFLVFAGLTVITWLLDTYLTLKGIIINRHATTSNRGFYEGIIVVISIILVSTTIKLLQRWMRDNEKINELRNITHTLELNELRNQINPHFLFNMLNGVKALIRIEPEKAITVIMKLSEFLRYQLYENNGEKTLLKSEISFLSNFLELEKLRRDNLSIWISSNSESQNLNSVFLPPNLFTTFVENAVKYSVNINGGDSFIHVDLNINEDKLYFSCINSKDPAYNPPTKGNNGGLGLTNIKRRLELLYGDRYLLQINSTEKEYSIQLTIPL